MKQGEPFVGAQVWYNEAKYEYYTVIEVKEGYFIARNSGTGKLYSWKNNQFLIPKYGESPKYSTTDLIKALKNEITRTGN